MLLNLQEKKSASHLCPEVAKSGDVSSCPYKDKCRFSHDLDGFKAQVSRHPNEFFCFSNILCLFSRVMMVYLFNTCRNRMI